MAAAVLHWDRLLTNGRESTAFYAEFTPAPVEPPSSAAHKPSSSQLHAADAINANPVPSERARPAWYYMPLPERQAWVQEMIEKLVTKALGKEVAGSQPLMMAGLDSLGTDSHLHQIIHYCGNLSWLLTISIISSVESTSSE